MMPLGARLTPDGRFLVTSNNDDVSGTMSIRGPNVAAGYSLSVIDTKTFTVVSQVNAVGPLLRRPENHRNWSLHRLGLRRWRRQSQALHPVRLGNADGRRHAHDSARSFGAGRLHVELQTGQGTERGGCRWEQAARPDRVQPDGRSGPPPLRQGSALSPDGRYLYVACNGDNSLAIIDTTTFKVVKQVPVGYFPYDVVVSDDGRTVFVSNWGVTEYKFANPTYGPDGTLTAIAPAGKNEPAGFFVPKTDTRGETPQTSSVAVVSVPDGGPREGHAREIRVPRRRTRRTRTGRRHASVGHRARAERHTNISLRDEGQRRCDRHHRARTPRVGRQ